MARHAWVKLGLHRYICQKCGCGKVNAGSGRSWTTTYHTPDGVSEARPNTPPCEPGPLSSKYLAHHSAAIALKAQGITYAGVSQ